MRKGLGMNKAVLKKTTLLFAFAAAFFLTATSGSRIQTGPALSPDPVFDEIARFISGLPCASDNLKALQETPEWKAYVAGLEKSWSELETKRLQPLWTWAETEIADSQAATTTLFYPFGGPDFLTAFYLYPHADAYVLMGLEFVGRLPDFKKDTPNEEKHVGNYLANLNAALADFFLKSYFITKNMTTALARDKVDGVLPVICFFLERTNNAIAAIKRCEVLDNGDVLEYDFGMARKVRRPYGIKIEFFARGTNKLRSLYYFSCDLSDEPFAKNTPFYLYADKLNFETTYVKSASYLMHYKFFSSIRGLILAKSRFVLEDDTGIPYKYFAPRDWESQLYGEYIKPVSDFKGVDQADLEAAYADAARIKKLPFHLGYHWGSNKDSILYFKKK